MPGIVDNNLSISVHLVSLPSQHSAPIFEPTKLQLACGAGRQILGWVAAASCARFAHVRLVPGSIECAVLQGKHLVSVSSNKNPACWGSKSPAHGRLDMLKGLLVVVYKPLVLRASIKHVI